MSKFVEFNGLKHYPIGDAKIEIVKGKLKVSNIGDSGMDGVAIRTNGAAKFETALEQQELSADQSIYVSHMGRDNYGRIKTVGERAIYFDPVQQQTAFAFNSKLLEEEVRLIGKLDGRTVFDTVFNNPENDPRINWWPIALAVGIFILDHVDYEHSTTTNSDGSSSTTETYSWGSIANPGGGGNPIEAFDGQRFEADRMYLSSTKVHPQGVPAPLALEIEEVRILGKNVPELVLTEQNYK